MNIHHLELFYYVATHRGISRAVRQMPYGIQQPAVSSHMLQLEEDVGARLFERVPFKLTPTGEKLYESIKDFFGGLSDLAEKISAKNQQRLRIGAAEMVLAEYLPPVLARLKTRYPDFRLGLRATGSAELEGLLTEGQIDVGLSPIDGRASTRIERELLVSLPLAILVPRASRWERIEELWLLQPGDAPLISLPAGERVSWLFAEELKKRRLDWPVSIEASSLSLVRRYVANGYGVGLTVHSPELDSDPEVRVLSLPNFPPLELYAVWHADPGPLVSAFLDEVRKFVRNEWPRRSRSRSRR